MLDAPFRGVGGPFVHSGWPGCTKVKDTLQVARTSGGARRFGEFAGVVFEVAHEDGQHLSEGCGLASKGHHAGALLRAERAEKRNKGIAIRSHLGEEVIDGGAFTLGDAGTVPIVDFELGGVLQVVARERYACADTDADQLAEVVGRHVGEQLAPGPGSVTGVDDFVPGAGRHLTYEAGNTLAGSRKLLRESPEGKVVHHGGVYQRDGGRT